MSQFVDCGRTIIRSWRRQKRLRKTSLSFWPRGWLTRPSVRVRVRPSGRKPGTMAEIFCGCLSTDVYWYQGQKFCKLEVVVNTVIPNFCSQKYNQRHLRHCFEIQWRQIMWVVPISEIAPRRKWVSNARAVQINQSSESYETFLGLEKGFARLHIWYDKVQAEQSWM